MNSEAGIAINRSLCTLKAVAFDVDGTLTDGKITWSPSGEEFKSFSFKDIMGISLLRRLGLKLALISGESTQQVDLFAAKMHIPFIAKGTRDKAAALQAFAAEIGVAVDEICFVGDDVNDLPAMEFAGFCVCPGDAAFEMAEYVAARAARGSGMLATHDGGHGAVRDFADLLLTARGLRGRDVFQMQAPDHNSANTKHVR